MKVAGSSGRGHVDYRNTDDVLKGITSDDYPRYAPRKPKDPVIGPFGPINGSRHQTRVVCPDCRGVNRCICEGS